jgi:2-isopropylmalate synthase
MIQGTLNGLGERCGNANLTALIPTLTLKLGYQTGVGEQGLGRLTEVSRMLDARLHRVPNRQAAYVGENAFAHKGGLHAAATARDSSSYEHIVPALVGNRRQVIVSNQAGRASLLLRLAEAGIAVAADDSRVAMLVETVKRREFEGYSYDGAAASFELLARRALGEVPELFRVVGFRVVDERRWNAGGELLTLSSATAEVEIAGRLQMAVAEGDDPIEALAAALLAVLLPAFPVLSGMRLADCRMRIHTRQEGTKAMTRVTLDSHDVAVPALGRWSTIGVSGNVIDAAFGALQDAIVYRLLCALPHG